MAAGALAAPEATLLPSAGDELGSSASQSCLSPYGPIVWGSLETPPWAPEAYKDFPQVGLGSSMASLTTEAGSDAAPQSLATMSITDLSLSEPASMAELQLVHTEALPEIVRLAGRGGDSAAATAGGVPTAEVYRPGSAGPCAVIPEMDPEVYERLLLLALYGEGASLDYFNRRPELAERLGEDLARRVLAELRYTPTQKMLNRHDKDQSGRFPCSNLKRALRSELRVSPAGLTDFEIEALLVALDEDNVGSFAIAELLDFLEQNGNRRLMAPRLGGSRPPSANRAFGQDSLDPVRRASRILGGSKEAVASTGSKRTPRKPPVRGSTGLAATQRRRPSSGGSSRATSRAPSKSKPTKSAQRSGKARSKKRTAGEGETDPSDAPDPDGKIESGRIPSSGRRATKERRHSQPGKLDDVDQHGSDYGEDMWNAEADILDPGRGVLYFPPVPYLVSIPLSSTEMMPKGSREKDADDMDADDYHFTSISARMSAGQPARRGSQEATGSWLPSITTPRTAHLTSPRTRQQLGNWRDPQLSMRNQRQPFPLQGMSPLYA